MIGKEQQFTPHPRYRTLMEQRRQIIAGVKAYLDVDAITEHDYATPAGEQYEAILQRIADSHDPDVVTKQVQEFIDSLGVDFADEQQSLAWLGSQEHIDAIRAYLIVTSTVLGQMVDK